MLDQMQIAGSGQTARALWYESAGKAVLSAAQLRTRGDDELLVRTRWSAISRGTERLIFEGRVPPAEYARMRAPFQEGDFPFPVKYGYCLTGLVEAGPPGWVGLEVFVLHPHEDRFVTPAAAAKPLPEGLPARRATLAANMETALNAIWDSGAGPGERIAVIGCGLVGLLVTYLCAQLPGADVVCVDIDPGRAEIARSFGASFLTPGAFAASGDYGADVVFHTSASPPGLSLAIGSAGLEARIIEMSWYGAGEVPVPLGGAFHSRRLQLISSQVGHVSPGRRPRWDYGRRISKAMELLLDPRLNALITDEFRFEELPEKLPAFLWQGAPGLAAVINYSQQE